MNEQEASERLSVWYVNCSQPAQIKSQTERLLASVKYIACAFDSRLTGDRHCKIERGIIYLSLRFTTGTIILSIEGRIIIRHT